MKSATRICLILLIASFHQGRAQKGVIIDLSTHDFEKGGCTLGGDWEFYWDKLLNPSNFDESYTAEKLHVPRSWTQLGHPILGVGTYHIKVLLPLNNAGLALYFPIINSSAKIWVNGELLKETGKVSSNRSHYRAQLAGTYVPLPEKISSAEIFVQVANFSYYHSGIASIPTIDKSAAVVEKLNRSNGIENFFAGCLIALFIYQIILYFLYHDGQPYLWLGLICLGVALRSMIVHGGSFLLPNLFPFVEWEYWKKIEFGSVYAISALFPLYVYHLFPQFAPRKPIWIFVFVAAVLFLAVLFTPQYVYGRVLDVCHAMLVLGFVYAVYGIGRAWRGGSEDARIILAGVLSSFPFILLEIVKNSQFLPWDFPFMYLVEIGVLVFLMFQVFLLASHYAKSYRHIENMNQSLEKMVAERTGQLSTANTVKDRLLSVMSHDIKSPLNSLRGMIELYNQGVMTQDEFKNFTRLIESDLNKTSMLVDNILFWTASQLKGVQIKIESFDLARLIDQNIQLFHTIAGSKKISMVREMVSPFVIRSDKNILHLVVRNLLSNAIKFSREEGSIYIRLKRDGSCIQLEVEDQGLGMDPDYLQKFLDEEKVISNVGTSNEKGAGLGLTLCRNYLKEINGELLVKSELQKGSTFIIRLPVSAFTEQTS